MCKFAKVAQLVEHDLAKVGVASSNLVFRSKMPSYQKAFYFRLTKPMEIGKGKCSGGGTGRHAGLKILCFQRRAGSIPAPSTSKNR